MKTVFFAFTVILTITANTAYATVLTDQNQENIGEEASNVFKKLISRFDEIFKAFDNWLNEKIGFNITKAIKFLGNVIIWIIQLVIKLAKWAVESIV